jgi:hypothetical protein
LSQSRSQALDRFGDGQHFLYMGAKLRSVHFELALQLRMARGYLQKAFERDMRISGLGDGKRAAGYQKGLAKFFASHLQVM